jgi:uncharacterized protein (DUF427 family)
MGMSTTDSPHLTITPTDLHVVVRVGDEVVADSHRPVVLEERGNPTRYYLPRDDVRTDLLRATERHTTCPYKGQASYWSLEVGGTVHENVVWSYDTPIPAAERITGLLCFYNDRVDLVVEGASIV